MNALEREILDAAIAYHDRSRTLDWAMHSEWDRLRAAIKAYRAQPGASAEEVAEAVSREGIRI